MGAHQHEIPRTALIRNVYSDALTPVRMDARGDFRRWRELVDDKIKGFYEEELARRDYTSSFYRKIHAEIEDYNSKGKRLRSLLLLVGWLTEDGEFDLDELVPIAAAIELLHSHFLIHDDIVDRDDVRRGGPAMHTRIEQVAPRGAVTDRDFAIIVGDLVMSHATKLFTESTFPAERLMAARRIISESMIETNIGKLYDLLDINQSLEHIEFEHILFIMTYRTSRYTIQMPLAVGATLAGSDRGAEPYEEFANYLGTAFHLHHDLSHRKGEDAQIRTDIRENKKTVLLKWLYDACEENDREFLVGLMGTRASDADYARVMELFEKHGIIERAEGYITELLVDAEAEIPMLSPNEKGAAYLRHIMRALAGQEKL